MFAVKILYRTGERQDSCGHPSIMLIFGDIVVDICTEKYL